MDHSHAYYVTKHAIRLSSLAEKPVLLIWAAMLHDIGNAFAVKRKIVESEIDQAKGSLEKYMLKKEAIEFREEHMLKGAIESKKILEHLGATEKECTIVLDMILYHDTWKFRPEFEYTHDQSLLIEADACWMLSPKGIEIDIERAINNNLKPMAIKDQFLYNYDKIINKINYSKDIVEEYRKIIFK